MRIILSYHSYWFLYYKHILLEKGGILEIWCSWFCVAQQDRQLLKNYYYKCHLEFVSMACGRIKNQTRLTCKVKFDGNSIDLMKAEDDY